MIFYNKSVCSCIAWALILVTSYGAITMVGTKFVMR